LKDQLFSDLQGPSQIHLGRVYHLRSCQIDQRPIEVRLYASLK